MDGLFRGWERKLGVVFLLMLCVQTGLFLIFHVPLLFPLDDTPIFAKSTHSQISVSVTRDMFVTAKLPLLTDVGGAYLVRLQLSPAAIDETIAIADTCRAGGSAVVTVKGASIPPFIVTKVTDEADALVLCLDRNTALAILHSLNFKEKDFGGWGSRFHVQRDTR